MSKNKVRRQIPERPIQQQPNMVPELEYKVWIAPLEQGKCDEIFGKMMEYLNQRSLEGWSMQGMPHEAFMEDRIVVTTTMARAKERKVLSPVGLG